MAERLPAGFASRERSYRSIMRLMPLQQTVSPPVLMALARRHATHVLFHLQSVLGTHAHVTIPGAM